MNAGEIQVKAQLNMIEEQVYGYHSKEKVSREPVFERETKTMDDVKLEVLGMNRRNKELELEKRELALKLNSAQAKTTSLSTMTEVWESLSFLCCLRTGSFMRKHSSNMFLIDDNT